MPKALVTYHHLQRLPRTSPAYEVLTSNLEILPKIAGQQLIALVACARLLPVSMLLIIGDDEIDASVLSTGKAAGLKAVIKWELSRHQSTIDEGQGGRARNSGLQHLARFQAAVADLALSLLLGDAARNPSDA